MVVVVDEVVVVTETTGELADAVCPHAEVDRILIENKTIIKNTNVSVPSLLMNNFWTNLAIRSINY